MNYSVKINDKSGTHIGDRINIGIEEIKQYIDKGFVVTDMSTGINFTIENILQTIGVSDGLTEL